MLTDLVLSPFGAGVDELVAAAQAADRAGFDTVWTYDHVSGLVAAAPWSRDPLVTLGAAAARTERVGLGMLVANMVNRHPTQLAMALDSLDSLAPGRARCGIGAGAGPGTRFAVEHTAIGRRLDSSDVRRAHLVEVITALRACWTGDGFRGRHVHIDAGMPLVSSAAPPPIVIGGSTASTIAVAAEHADGVNIQDGARLAEHVELARRLADDRPFEVGVFRRLDVDHPTGGDADDLRRLRVGRRTLHVSRPFPLERITAIGAALAGERVR